MNTRHIHLLALAAALVLLLTVAGRIGIQAYRNDQKTRSFTYNSSNPPYQRGVPMDQMDLTELDRYLSIATTLISIKVTNTLDLPEKITYYKEQDGKKVPVLELPKGTTIQWIPTKELNDLYFGYGYESYPTYEKGWRYAKPFMISGKGTDYRHLPFYYFVRTSDLESVAKKAIKSTKPLANTLKAGRISIRDGVYYYTRYIDNIFYNKGVFFSPDLFQPIWRPLDTIMTVFASALLLLSLYIGNKTKAPDIENSKCI